MDHDVQPIHARIAEFIQRYCEDALHKLVTGAHEHPQLAISLMDVYRYDPDLFDDLVAHPDPVLSDWFRPVIDDFSAVCEAVVYTNAEDFEGEKPDVDLFDHELPEDIQLLLVDPPRSMFMEIGETRMEYFDSLIAIEGICQQMSDPKPRILSATFECQRCGAVHGPMSLGGSFELEGVAPHKCQGCERKGPFARLREQEEWAEYQQIRVQEPPEDAVNPANPREVICDIEGDEKIDRLSPGERVAVVGILREDPDNESVLRDSRLETYGVIPEERQFDDMEFEKEEIEQFEELAADPELFSHLKNSVAPTIFGHDLVKLGVALQLFGGVTKHKYGNRKRGEIHIFLIGDPGTGKSQILESGRRIAPRAIQANGSNSTSAGLTATAVQEKIGGDEQWTLRAGALVLADGGLITIDELDNMDYEKQQSLDEALSDGSIVVNKADVHAQLNARCSALMAANPARGRFDPYEPYSEQFDMPEELLDRCDLVFLFTDKPDPEMDEKIAEIILDSHASPASMTADGGIDVASPVDDRGVIDHELLRKYIAYARRECRPSLTEEASEELQEFYSTVRGLSKEGQISFNGRKFEGVIRLAQASARARLSDDVTLADVERATELVMESMRQAGYDEGEGFDVDLVEGRTAPPSQKKRMNRVASIIQSLQEEHSNGAPVEKVIEYAVDEGMTDEQATRAIESYKKKGDAYSPQSGHVRMS